MIPAARQKQLRWQRRLGRLAFALVGPGCVFTMRVLRNNRLVGAARARRVYAEALATGRPIVIAANHLTMVDSGFLHWALSPLWRYLADYRRFSWNVAAVEHFGGNLFLRALVYFGKTLPIDRFNDEAARREVLHELEWLVSSGDVLTIFPEGMRSPTGRVDVAQATYGVGQILMGLERPLVLCAYLRGRRQEAASAVPAWGDTVDIRVEPLEPSTPHTGLRAVRDLSRQVVGRLKAMEDDWLAQRGMGPVAKP